MKACMASFTKLIFFIVLVTLVSENHVHGRFVVETESIKVLSPLNRRSKHDGAIGNFGVPDYGGYIVGSVVYPEKGSFGCDPFDGDKPFRSRSPRPTFVLLDRGGNLLLFNI